MKSIRVLDVTLRDGGCVNNFNFGYSYMQKILAALESSHVDIIELGYIDEKNGSLRDRTQYLNETVITDSILHNKKQDITYVAMMDYGKFNIDNLGKRSDAGIDGIRLAFHKKNYIDMLPLGRKIIEKGYKLFIQPMITYRYTDVEVLDLIQHVNDFLPDAAAFYIVDSFGEMRPDDLIRVLSLVDHNLVADMPIGFHSHNNIQMAYSNACSMMEFKSDRDIIIDSSIMGMGKGAGNLNTELLIEHLNRYYHKHYSITPLLSVIDKVINQIHDEFYWGYSVEYYLSSINHCTPSYAGHFYNKHMLSIEQVNELLSMITEEKRISFDKNYAEELYRDYNMSLNIDDTEAVNDIKNKFEGKKILLIAPGKSILKATEQIVRMIKSGEYIVIGLNATIELTFDFILTTRKDIYINEIKRGRKVIAPSSVVRESDECAYVLNYGRWIDKDDRTHDSSAVIALNLLEFCEVGEIALAGFDGFSVDINQNYYDPEMRHPVNSEQAERRNLYYKKFIHRKIDKGVRITFITPSLYER